MSILPPDENPSSGLGRARDKIAYEEQYADNMNLARELRRAQGGGVIKRTLKRILGRPRDADRDDDRT